ncbi:MAG: hypothetical protein P8177_04375, partial [Gemmatimonadota bacterium]
MNAPFRPSFWEELRRRRVVRAIAVYGVVAWVVVQVADVFFPALRMPEWTLTLVAVLAVIGFPVTVALAWIFDRTPEGVRRASASEADHGRPDGLDRRFISALALGVVAGVVVVGAGFWITGRLTGFDDGPGPGAGAPDRGGAQVIAVLPFEPIGEANPTFTDGIHMDVLTRLANVSGLDVISRGSVVGYRESTEPASAVAEDLGAGWILRGEVQQVGDQVRVHARLVDARRDRQVWADAFGGALTAQNLCDIQRDITRRIVAALETRLTPGEVRAAERPVT